jgi:DNA-binding NarL/FixJ family response regulator
MEKRIRILLVDDHRIFLEGLKEIINQESGMEVVATAEHGAEALVKLSAYHVDVVILDIQMPQMNGFDTVEHLLERYPNVRILMLSMHAERNFVQRVYNLGVHGYLLKHTSRQVLLEAIQAVHSGERYFEADAAHSFLEQRKGYNTPEKPSLSKREIEILVLIANEYSNPDIAHKLHLSVETVNTHRKNLLQKIGVRNTAGLVKYAVYNRLI